jgi:hypothetical protein
MRTSGRLLAFAVLLVAPIVSAQMHTIVLSTGLAGQTGTTPIALFQNDDDWTLVADPLIPHPIPRPAVVVDANGPGHMKWALTLPNSRWISGAGNKYNGLLPASTPSQTHSTSFLYRMCFMLPSAYWQPSLALQLRGDDAITSVTVNYGTTLYAINGMVPKASLTTGGSFLGPALTVVDTAAAHFHPGQNCVDVGVTDLDSMVSGLNVAGTVTYQGWPQAAACTYSGQLIDVALSTGTDFNGTLNPSGSADVKWSLVSRPPGPAGGPYVINAYSSWVPNVPTARWIERLVGTTAQGDAVGTYSYRLPLPPLNVNLYSSISLIMRYAADDAAIVRLNSSIIDSCGASCFAAWRNIAVPVTALNNLTVDVKNNSGNTGLIVDAKLRATCK